MKSASLTIVPEAGHALDFYVSTRFTINGNRTRCISPPHGRWQGFMCQDWPPSLVLGKTKVTVIYWETARDGVPVRATNQVQYRR